MVEFFFQAEDGIRDIGVTGVQTCALPISIEGYPANGICCSINCIYNDVALFAFDSSTLFTNYCGFNPLLPYNINCSFFSYQVNSARYVASCTSTHLLATITSSSKALCLLMDLLACLL